eukprot:9661824-Karenia_brevis.AAC.1
MYLAHDEDLVANDKKAEAKSTAKSKFTGSHIGARCLRYYAASNSTNPRRGTPTAPGYNVFASKPCVVPPRGKAIVET